MSSRSRRRERDLLLFSIRNSRCLAALGMTGILRLLATLLSNQPHRPRLLHKLQRPMYHRRVDHLGAQADDGESLLVSFLIGGDDLQGLFDFRRRWRESLVNNGDLERVDASHAFKSQSPRGLSPPPQPVHVGEIAVD